MAERTENKFVLYIRDPVYTEGAGGVGLEHEQREITKPFSPTVTYGHTHTHTQAHMGWGSRGAGVMGTEGAELSPPGTVICPSGQSRAGEAGTSPPKAPGCSGMGAGSVLPLPLGSRTWDSVLPQELRGQWGGLRFPHPPRKTGTNTHRKRKP